MEDNFPTPNDQILMSPEQLADSVGVSRAFIHTVVDAGCPTWNGLLTLHSFFAWLESHVERVRFIVGLPDLPPIPVHAGETAADMKRKRALLTLLEFMQSRACSESTKRTCVEGVKLLLEEW